MPQRPKMSILIHIRQRPDALRIIPHPDSCPVSAGLIKHRRNAARDPLAIPLHLQLHGFTAAHSKAIDQLLLRRERLSVSHLDVISRLQH